MKIHLLPLPALVFHLVPVLLKHCFIRTGTLFHTYRNMVSCVLEQEQAATL